MTIQIMAVKENKTVPFDIVEHYASTYKKGSFGYCYADIETKTLKYLKVESSDAFINAVKGLTSDKLKGSGVIFYISDVIGEEEHQPFFIENEIAYVHEGWITGIAETHKGSKGCSYYLHQKIFKDFKPSWFQNDFIDTMLTKIIGTTKIAFLKTDGSIYIANEVKGSTTRDIWSSNIFTYDPQIKNKPIKNSPIVPYYTEYFQVCCSKCHKMVSNRSAYCISFYQGSAKKTYHVCEECFEENAFGIQPEMVGYNVT